MKLPHNNKELTKIFLAGKKPDIAKFKNEYWVDVLTGIIPNLRRFQHRKRFFLKDKKYAGFNILFKNRIFGHFLISKSKDLNVDVAEFNYNQKENSFLFRRIIDNVRSIDGDNLYLGRLTYKLFGKYRFIGYFTMTKIK